MNYSIASVVIMMTHKYDSLASHIGEDGGDMLVNSSRTLKIFFYSFFSFGAVNDVSTTAASGFTRPTN